MTTTLKVKDWLKTKNNKQFEIFQMAGKLIMTATRISDKEKFGQFSKVFLNGNIDVLYKIVVFSEDLIHIGIIPEEEKPSEATVITTPINDVRKPTLEEYFQSKGIYKKQNPQTNAQR